jgi:hypothetical protein
MQKSSFDEWNQKLIENTFDLVEVDELPFLKNLISYKFEPNKFEENYLKSLQNNYLEFGGDDWNDREVMGKMISPIIVSSEIQNKRFSYFLEREISADVDRFQLFGKLDGMIATGFSSPQLPYFCLHKSKSDEDSKGQVLIAMLVAQKLNDNKKPIPIYGSYIIGRNWYFMVLEGNKYAISNDYSCVDDEIFDIFRILKSLRVQIEKLL